MLRNRFVRVAAILIVLAALPAGAYAFTASNIQAGSSNHAGSSSQAVTGYGIGAPSYHVDTSDPTKISSVSFTIAPDAPNIYVSLDNGASWKSCGPSSGGTATCGYAAGAGPTIAGITTFDVSATQ